MTKESFVNFGSICESRFNFITHKFYKIKYISEVIAKVVIPVKTGIQKFFQHI